MTTKWGEWAVKARRWFSEKGLHMQELENIANAMDELHAFGNDAWERRRKAAVWVQVDLRQRIDNQLDSIHRDLRGIQLSMLKMHGREGVLQQKDADILYQKIYSYLRIKRDNVPPIDVAAEVFPGAMSNRRARKVAAKNVADYARDVEKALETREKRR